MGENVCLESFIEGFVFFGKNPCIKVSSGAIQTSEQQT
jgi:hypothetical protein